MKVYKLTFHDFVMDIEERKAFLAEKDAIRALLALKDLHLSIHHEKADYCGAVSCLTIREDADLLMSIVDAINDCEDYAISREEVRSISS